MGRTITVTSGKGGVGKTNLSANLALQLAQQGNRVCVLDADLGLANINIILGLHPDYTIEDLLFHDRKLSEVMITDYHGIDIIPGCSGVEQVANLEPGQTDTLIRAFEGLEDYDYVFFDTSAGISRHVVAFCLASSELILVITPEPTALTDAYALLKVLCANDFCNPVRIMVNQAKNTAVAKQTYGKFKAVVQKYLDVNLSPLGVILHDANISEAVKQQQPFTSLYPSTVGTKCIQLVARNLIKSGPEATSLAAPDMASFWIRCISLLKRGFSITVKPGAPAKADRPGPVTAMEAKTEPAGATDAPQEEPSPPRPLHAIEKQPDQVQFFQKMAEGITAVSTELKLLRQVIEKQTPGAAAGSTPCDASAVRHEEKQTELLDFGAFLKKRMHEDQT